MSSLVPLLQSPVPGFIFPPGSSWSGGAFGVISTLADHIRTGRGKGTDIASFPTAAGAPVRLMRSGVCYQKYIQPMHNPPQIGDGALICRFRDALGNHGYAHLSRFGNIAIGRTYPVGTIVGYVGSSGTSKPHLHTHWQTPDGVHHEVYYQMEQSHNMAFNAGVVGVNIRLAPGVAAPKWGSCQAIGIIRADGTKVAERNAILVRRRVVKVIKDGFEWMPIHIANQAADLWVAKPFIHFV